MVVGIGMAEWQAQGVVGVVLAAAIGMQDLGDFTSRLGDQASGLAQGVGDTGQVATLVIGVMGRMPWPASIR